MQVSLRFYHQFWIALVDFALTTRTVNVTAVVVILRVHNCLLFVQRLLHLLTVSRRTFRFATSTENNAGTCKLKSLSSASSLNTPKSLEQQLLEASVCGPVEEIWVILSVRNIIHAEGSKCYEQWIVDELCRIVTIRTPCVMRAGYAHFIRGNLKIVHTPVHRSPFRLPVANKTQRNVYHSFFFKFVRAKW